MARIDRTKTIDGRQVRFSFDRTTKVIGAPFEVDANDLVQAIAEEFSNEQGIDYPLRPCLNTDTGRELAFNDGWSLEAAHVGNIMNRG
jgi:hypothetical protein